jgi:hypothetical protein
VLDHLPRVQGAEKGPDVGGADLVFTFDGGIEALDLHIRHERRQSISAY